MRHPLIKEAADRAKRNHAAHVVIIKRGGAIIAIGYNHDGIHAEHMALNKLWPSERKGTKLYSFRIRANGQFGLAKPCSKCWQLIVASGVKVVYYSTNDGLMERLKV